MIQNGNARGYNGFLVDKRGKMVAQSVFVVQHSNNEVDKSFEMVLRNTFEVQHSTNCACICGNVSIHSGCVSIQNGNARGHSHNIYKSQSMK